MSKQFHYHMYPHTCFFHILPSSFPLITINIIIYLANIYQVSIMSKTVFWAPFKHSCCLQRVGGRHFCVYYDTRWYRIRVKSQFIGEKCFSDFFIMIIKQFMNELCMRYYFYGIVLFGYSRKVFAFQSQIIV